ncbi:MAG: Thiol:disulfide interchange protein DsbD [Chlamydiales bacterium]|nr:Thiol:disulfide interchange protein DsbD [Chlamydiales bacterium]MCH9619449.1 Thiol:disulfide interchange protein DsbD [Chlamydiales bacterium]MCH9622253.1 Thiol:disulfide interchange protein DsbD [Chlamydiales bacterium]
MKLIRLVLPLFCLFAFSPLAHAAEGAQEPVKATLVSENTSVAAGEPFWVGVELKMADGWDTYWQNPGDAGFPTQINWQLPEGFEAGSIKWPYPEKFTNESMVGFGYTDSVLLLTEITPPKVLPSELIDLKANVTWLACNDSCQPGQADLHLTLPVTDQAPTKDREMAKVFEKVKAALPQDTSATVKTKKDEIIVNLKSPKGNFDSVVFIPQHGEVIDYQAPQEVKMSRGGVEVSLKRFDGSDVPQELRGVMLFKEKGSEVVKALQIDSIFGATGELGGAHATEFWVALGLAFLGGILLNVMPCVMPVIALKIFSFVKMAHEKRSLIFKHGLTFTMGVMVSFWLLSGALLLLRAYGQSVGWGFQLQEPAFVVILAGILFLLGLSLFGVFELGTSLISLGQKTGSSQSSPMMSSFLSGVLATLVATPCTGPLLGPALGFALTLAPIKALLIFTGMGLGMASPYLIFAAFPKLVRFLPKPGNWMITFKQIMGFLMMATVVWLIWVFGAQTGNLATMLLLISLLIMGVGAWIYGKWASPIHKKPTRLIATSIALIAITFGVGNGVMTAKKYRDVEVGQIADQSGAWQSFTPQRVAELQAAGTPVFVDFTAKWCLICQANKVVLHSSDMATLFNQHGIVTMMADWTKKDPVITEQLEKLGRSGVPVYVLYPGEKGADPYVLPQTLSSKVIQEYVDKLHAQTN